MYASNRRHERRADVLEMLKSQYRVQTIVDYSGLEPDGIFLEGTGAMVLDHVSRVAYTALSHRADTHVLERFCTDFGYEPMAFDAVDSEGVPVYHTNVIACIGTDVAMIALEMIPDAAPARAGPRAALGQRADGRGADRGADPRVRRQRRRALRAYAGGPAPLHHGHVGAGRAAACVRTRSRRSRSPARSSPSTSPRSSWPAGSVRCMIAGVHLDRRPAVEPEPTAAVEAIDENPHTADGQDVAMGDSAD